MGHQQPVGGTSSKASAKKPRTIEITLVGDRAKLFKAWHPIANLADMVSSVTVVVRAESELGFDMHKVEVAVLEPLREVEVLKE